MAEGCHHNTVAVPTQADTLLTSPFDCKFTKDATKSSGVFTCTSPLWHLVTTMCFASEPCICSSPHFTYPRGLIFCSQLLNENQIHKKITRKSFHAPSPNKGYSSQTCKAAHLCSFLVMVRSLLCKVIMTWLVGKQHTYTDWDFLSLLAAGTQKCLVEQFKSLDKKLISSYSVQSGQFHPQLGHPEAHCALEWDHLTLER